MFLRASFVFLVLRGFGIFWCFFRRIYRAFWYLLVFFALGRASCAVLVFFECVHRLIGILLAFFCFFLTRAFCAFGIFWRFFVFLRFLSASFRPIVGFL